MGAEKWLDIELWNSPAECFEDLRMRGYRIATTHLGIDTVNSSVFVALSYSCMYTLFHKYMLPRNGTTKLVMCV